MPTATFEVIKSKSVFTLIDVANSGSNTPEIIVRNKISKRKFKDCGSPRVL
jgi:hypothetical protein